MANVAVFLVAFATVLLSVQAASQVKICKSGCVDKGKCPKDTKEVANDPDNSCPTFKQNQVCCVKGGGSGGPGEGCAKKQGKCIMELECKEKKGEVDPTGCDAKGHICCLSKDDNVKF